MNLLSQPFDGQLGEYLLETLDSGAFDSLSVVVAFAKNSGVLRLRESLQRFRETGRDLHFYVGVDMNGTSYEALTNLLPVATTLRVIHDESGQTFHTKLFNFAAKDRSVLVVGSHNLTAGGLWTSFESSIRLQLDHGKPDHLQMQKDVNCYLERLCALRDSVKLIGNENDIQELLSNQYVEKEVKEQIRRRRASQAVLPREALFGTASRAQLPSLPRISVTPSLLPSSTAPDDGESGNPTLWLETRRMTGGSRNILDLSKTSLLRGKGGFMTGAVAFFGVDPEEIDIEKEIVVNYEGTNYAGNTIKFPKGEHANGTWRVQLKGVSDKGVKITTVFREHAGVGDFLPEKIVTFTRVRDDYYYFSVFDKADLAEFLDASAVTAYNGRSASARLLGFL